MNYFITGIGTGIGKTVVSAVLTEALGAAYYKPIQAGSLERTDRDVVTSLVSNPQAEFLPERWRLTEPMSPHAAARIDGVRIEGRDLTPPATSRPLVIEGAGGLLVPINDDELIADVIQHFDAQVVVVSQNYLGSINHSLMTLECLRHRELPVAGIVFNGDRNEETEAVILHRGGIRCLARIPRVEALTPERIGQWAQEVDLP